MKGTVGVIDAFQ